MRISILGGGGFLGRKIAARLASEGALGGKAVTSLTLFDITAPPKPDPPLPAPVLPLTNSPPFPAPKPPAPAGT